MERITNDIQKLFEEARREITDFSLSEGEQIIYSLSEYPAIVDLPFQMVIIQDHMGKMKYSSRTWDRNYDLIRWKEGIYNLDRLRILSQDKQLSLDQAEKLLAELKKISKSSLADSLAKKGVIVLDGSEWELKLAYESLNRTFKWNTPNEQIEIFLPLIEWMLGLSEE